MMGLQHGEIKMTGMFRVLTQETPNPNARKFIVAKDVKSRGKISYTHPAECLHVPLASTLLSMPEVSQVHLFENVLTVTQSGALDWAALEDQVKDVIQNHLGSHDPEFATDEVGTREHLSAELQEIDLILDRTIRPGLQSDGGDLQVLEINDNLLTVRYEGACGSCPSAQSGTLQAIEGILRDEYRADLVVQAI